MAFRALRYMLRIPRANPKTNREGANGLEWTFSEMVGTGIGFLLSPGG
jgi:hypothetical protein